jgi:hypothetical protein
MQRQLWLVITIFLSVVLANSLVQAGEPIDFTDCRNLTRNMLAKADGMSVRSSDFSGITMSNMENKMFDNWTHPCVGVGADVDKERIRHGFCKYMDPDGDLTLLEYPADPNNLYTWKYIGGTGKWKGITGGGEWKITRVGKPIEPNTFQFCTRVTGTYELPK